jgi:hypothetical protein
MSKIEVNAIEPQCGTNLTVGASGDTITFPSGTTVVNNGSQTGFGREGSVDWQTADIKTATFTAANGEGYFCNTSGGAFTVNLPAGSAGVIVSVSDYTRTFATNNLTISPNGSEKIGGIAGDAVLNINGQAATFVYVDGTEGWINVQETQTSQTGSTGFIMATGGTETTCGNCKIHTFTGPGTFQVTGLANTPANNAMGYMVVAGGGGGGGELGGGGGAGGFREGRNNPITPYTASPLAAACSALTATVSSYPITVGGGGTGSTSSPVVKGDSGSPSSFDTITSAGGGGGGSNNSSPGGETMPGIAGGSGGGGAGSADNNGGGGAGNTPSVSPPQGSAGGTASLSAPNYGAAGGGGATAVGGGGTSTAGGAGGAGASTSITGASVQRAGGGGGAVFGCGGTAGSGGAGGGGAGGNNTCGTDGTTNTGGGGGGARGQAGNGGSGVVIIRYKFQ